MEEDGSVKKISGFAEIRDLLVEAEEEDLDTTAYLTFRCRGRSQGEITNETVKKAVALSEIIAELLPTWTELRESALKAVERRQVPDLMEAIMSHAFLFRAKCDLVKALITAGFTMHHDDFAPKALQLHKHFDPAPDGTLFNFFPGRDNAELRDEVLIAQLDVLTNTWRYLPQIIKEDRIILRVFLWLGRSFLFGFVAITSWLWKSFLPGCPKCGADLVPSGSRDRADL